MMKNLMIALFLILGFSIHSFSQEFKGGVYAGIIGSQVAGDNLSGYNKAGVDLGVFTQLSISDKFSLQMELAYMMKGSQKNPDKKNNFSYKLHTSYIQIPILAQFEIIPNFRIEAGIAGAVLISSYEEKDAMELISKDSFNSFSLSFIGGVSYQINERFKIAILTNNDLTSVKKRTFYGMGVRRIGEKRGQYNDLLSLRLYLNI
ncbi:MAG: porin family protein [Bacteroidales bacterium]